MWKKGNFIVVSEIDDSKTNVNDNNTSEVLYFQFPAKNFIYNLIF